MIFLVTKFNIRNQKFFSISVTQDAPRGGCYYASLAWGGIEPPTSSLWGWRAATATTSHYVGGVLSAETARSSFFSW